MKARNWLLTTCFSLSVLLLVGGLTIAPPERVAAALQPQVTVKPSPRYGYTMATISDTAYLFGGTNITPTQGILSGPLRPAGNLYNGKEVAVDGSGNVYVTGHGQGAWSLPPVSGFKGMADVFVAKLDANGNWQWHTFLGSAGTEQREGIALDTGGNIYVVGLGDQTWGSPFRPKAGPWDGFVAQLNNSGVLMWNAFLGSDNTISYSEAARGVAVDGTGKVNVVGWSMGTWGSPIRPYAGNGDAFVAQIGERPPGDVWLYLPLVLRYTP